MKSRLILYLGVVDLTFWFIDVTNKVLFEHLPYRLLWYSSMGLLLTSIGLLKKNSFLLTSMFCALFLIEGLWVISFFSYPLIGHNLTPVAAYAFDPHYPKFEFYTTFYHLLIVPSVILGIVRVKVNRWGFLGASFYSLALILLSMIFVPMGDNVNCVQAPCQGVFSFIYRQPRFESIFVVVAALGVIVYFPLNLLALKINKKFRSYRVPRINPLTYRYIKPTRFMLLPRLGRQSTHRHF